MLYSNLPRTHFARPQLAEVICQLRFSPILSIDTNEPAEFQEAIRAMFPRYVVGKDQLPPRVVGAGTPQAKFEPPVSVNNYHFLSADNRWKLNLTRGFISLSTVAYPGWETFAKQIDQPLAEFIRIYQPAFFERIGLRYMNIISRAALDLEDMPWSSLITAPYLGPLAQEDVRDSDVIKTTIQTELRVNNSCHAKIQAGPGLVKRNIPNAPPDNEVKFIFDLDLSMPGQSEPRMAAAALEMLHQQSYSIFQGAITDELRQAMQPQEII
ncbi:MAG: TIGR04255 family protein [Oscillospiraceae bacterium]|nr:TIGR04255 family protein [Oscillospiraceae bacterium]